MIPALLNGDIFWRDFLKMAGMFYFSKTECSDQGKGYNLYPVNMIAMMSWLLKEAPLIFLES